MIKQNIINGSLETTLHDFKIHTKSMDLFISGTHYTNQGNVLIEHDGEEIEINIPTPTKHTSYEIWLTTDGVSVLSKLDGDEFGELVNPIDRLAWFKVPANCTNLDEIEINTVVMNP